MWQQFITVVIVHGYSQKVRVLNEVRLGTGGAHVEFVSYVVTLERKTNELDDLNSIYVFQKVCQFI